MFKLAKVLLSRFNKVFIVNKSDFDIKTLIMKEKLEPKTRGPKAH